MKKRSLWDLWCELDWTQLKLAPHYNATHVGSDTIKVSFKNALLWYIEDTISYYASVDDAFMVTHPVDSFNLSKCFISEVLEIDPAINNSLVVLVSATIDMVLKKLKRISYKSSHKWSLASYLEGRALFHKWSSEAVTHPFFIDNPLEDIFVSL